MSTKNLARTALEGGRAKGARVMERIYTRSERRAVSHQLRRSIGDPEYLDEVVFAIRKIGERDLTDKLTPIRRWINSQVGRKWDDVYSEISQTFKGNTLQGNHILDHIKGKGGYVNFNRTPPIYHGKGHWITTYDFEVEGKVKKIYSYLPQFIHVYKDHDTLPHAVWVRTSASWPFGEYMPGYSQLRDGTKYKLIHDPWTDFQPKEGNTYTVLMHQKHPIHGYGDWPITGKYLGKTETWSEPHHYNQYDWDIDENGILYRTERFFKRGI